MPKSRAWSGRDDDPRCTARAKSKLRQGKTGEEARCGNAAAAWSNVCQMHGAGNSADKAGGRPVVTGRYSKVLGKFRVAYNEALNDKSLLDLREPIALLDALAKRHAERLEENDTHAFRKRALDLYSKAQAASAGGDASGAARHMTALGRLLRAGGTEDTGMVALSNALERVARTVKSAWEIKLARKNSVNAADLVAVFARFVDIVQSHTDADTAKIVANDIQRQLLGYRRN